jgi:hypothetical protein
MKDLGNLPRRLHGHVTHQSFVSSPQGSSPPCPHSCAPTTRAAATMRSPRAGSGDRFEQPGRALAAADAHGDDGVTAAAPAQLGERGRGELGAGAAEQVAEREGPAVDAELVVRDLELALHVERLAGKRLVELNQNDFAHGQATLTAPTGARSPV